jgi:hypothetical protein
VCPASFLSKAIFGKGQESVQRKSSNISYELREDDNAEAIIVIPIVWVIVVAIGRTTILSVIVPRATAQNPIRTHDSCPK